MNPGKLNKKIIIQKKLSSKPLEDTQYIDCKRPWANVRNLYGKERLEAQKINPNIDKKIIIRYVKELDPSLNKYSSEDYRVEYKNQIYNILYIDNIKEENMYMELMLEVI